jgi:hypothetical protein
VLKPSGRPSTSPPSTEPTASQLLSGIRVRPMIAFNCHVVATLRNAVHLYLVRLAMNSQDNQDRDRAMREKIVSQMRSLAKGPKKRTTAEELQNLNRAAKRLDQMLKAVADADQQALKSAAARLDRLLSNIRAGKDVTNILKRPG